MMNDAATLRLLRTCFGFSAEDGRRTLDLLGRETFRFEPDDAAGGAGGPAAMLSAWSTDQWFGGRPVRSRAIALVGTDPLYRRQGHANRLLRRCLNEACDSGDALAVLYPATLPPYTGVGFARGGISQRFACPPEKLTAAVPEPGALVRLDPIDADLLAGVREREARLGNGFMTRTEAMWTYALHPDGAEAVDAYVVPGPGGDLATCEGYVVLLPPNDDRLEVVDLAILSGRAARAILALLASYRSRVDRVVWPGNADDPLNHMASDAGVALDSWEEWLLRIVNVPAALTGRGYPPTVSGQLTIFVTDPIFENNNQAWYLEVKDGQGFVIACLANELSDVKISIDALASLFSGYLNPAALYRMGKLNGDEKKLTLLMSLFSGPLPWMVDRF